MASSKSSSATFLETVIVILEALFIALAIRTFLYQPFNIPSGSMKANLLIGDYLFVNKFAYGYSKHSFPFSIPLFEGRAWSTPPVRGDVIVFKTPRDNATDYIKRLIGLPGDHIQMKHSVLYINGQEVKRERVDDFEGEDAFDQPVMIPQFRETLPNGVTYNTLDMTQNGSLDDTQEYIVPEGHYFFMGDNRDNSSDSRVLNDVGYVPEINLLGRAEVIFFSVNEGQPAWMFWNWPWTVRWNRLFHTIH
ncbi:MAG: signal peptidase I [Pseudomonadota bacterium]